MKIALINQECEIEDSKLFGEVYLPNEWLEEDVFSPFEFFLCQLNLEQLKIPDLPQVGYLYFFVDAFSLTESKMKAKVRYFSEEPDAYTDFNDGYFDCDLQPILIKGEQNSLFQKNIEILNLVEVEGDRVKLLELPTKLLPFELNSEKMVFVIDKVELEKLNFAECRLVFIN